ncbi:hypothetical protein OG943_14260 [Amycolatopsis sp. NBC_00345]|uniref:hypothetical protein n=1 Tax=Amycolatopsis sp. NBC_00345 TaxID=2975955 RepID=UPI002E2698F3
MDEDDLLDSHPDLVDPEWRKHAQADARLGARKDRRRQRAANRSRGHRRPRRRWWIFAAVLTILAVTGALVVLAGRRPAAEVAAPNPTAVPILAPVDLARPYAHTPAELWPKGMDGISSPAAAAVGPFKAEAVTDAYAQARRAIVAGRLDPAALFGHDPKAFAALLAPDERDQLTPLLTGKPAKGKSAFSGYLTEIADGYHLLDAGPRTSGTLTAHPGKAGELAVDANYVVAYAFDNVHPGGLTSPAEIVSFLRVDETYVVRSGPSFAEASHGLWVENGHSGFSSVGCAAAKEGFLAPGYANPPAASPTGEHLDAPGYYDPKYPVPTLDSCPPN